MSGDKSDVARDRLLVVRRWLAVADLDVRSAYACLDTQEPIRETAAYHCQQAVEKLAKGLLVLAQVPFRKTHDLEALRDLVAAHFPDLTAAIDRLVPLTDWGHIYRYPDISDEPVPSLEELRNVLGDIVTLAEAVLSRIEPIPPPALR
ncbi:MAG TPA: HEPN domain-containing protein [Acetobacteraceae bacterium]|jgi:HEPN domain-containing protein